MAAHTTAVAARSHSNPGDLPGVELPQSPLVLVLVLAPEYSPMVSSAHGTTASTPTRTGTPGPFSTQRKTGTRRSPSSAFARSSPNAAATTMRTPSTRRTSWVTAAMLASTRVWSRWPISIAGAPLSSTARFQTGQPLPEALRRPMDLLPRMTLLERMNQALGSASRTV